MTISFEEAEAKLASGRYTTVQSILDLLQTVCLKVAGTNNSSTYLLYGGKLADGSEAADCRSRKAFRTRR